MGTQRATMGRNGASGSMAGEKFWEIESNNKGMSMMKGMGWSKGEGLGNEGKGSTEYLRATKRPDNRGIGATTSQDNMWYASIGDVYNSVLSKLNKGKAGGAAAEAAEDSSEEEAPTMKKALARRGLYRRFNKHLSEVSAEDLAKVTGQFVRPKKKNPNGTEIVESEDEDEAEGVDDKEVVVKTSKMSMADYFASKQLEATGGLRRSPRLLAQGNDSMATMAQMSLGGGLGLGLGAARAPLPSQDEAWNAGISASATSVPKREVVYNNRSHVKKRKKVEEEKVEEAPEEEPEAVEEEAAKKKKDKKKKKKKKKSSSEEEEEEEEAPKKKKKKKVVEESEEEEEEAPKKKEKKSKKEKKEKKSKK